MSLRLALAAVVAALTGGLAAAQPPPPRAAAPSRPLVLELFTSEGCSSCPPADRLLAELAQRPGVLALGLHVTYWNSLGWRDPWSLDAATERQRTYARTLSQDSLFTPELVVDGRLPLVGSDRSAILRALAAARPAQRVTLALHETPGGIDIAAGPGEGEASLLLFGYDPSHTTAIGRGENAGRTLREADIVRSVTHAADWHGAAEHVVLPRPAGAHLAALLQAPDGTILAVATAS